MDEDFDEDDDIDFKAPLDVRYVIVGLIFMVTPGVLIVSLPAPLPAWLAFPAIVLFLSSFVIMTKRRR